MMVLSEWEHFLLLVALWKTLEFQVWAVFPATTFRTTNKYPPMRSPVPIRSCSNPTHLLSAAARHGEAVRQLPSLQGEENGQGSLHASGMGAVVYTY